MQLHYERDLLKGIFEKLYNHFNTNNKYRHNFLISFNIDIPVIKIKWFRDSQKFYLSLYIYDKEIILEEYRKPYINMVLSKYKLLNFSIEEIVNDIKVYSEKCVRKYEAYTKNLIKCGEKYEY